MKSDVITSFRLKGIDEHPANLRLVYVVEEKILLQDPCKASQLSNRAGKTKFNTGLDSIGWMRMVRSKWYMFNQHGNGTQFLIGFRDCIIPEE